MQMSLPEEAKPVEPAKSTTPFRLTLEQEFNVNLCATYIGKVPRAELETMVLSLIAQMNIKDNVIKDVLKKGEGF